MNSPIDYPETMTPEAKDIISMLLIRDPAKRLANPEEIRKHPFFKGIDWDLLFQKKITPPFIPSVTDAQDVSQIDPYFTEEAPNTDIDTRGEKIEQDTQNDFAGFTYVGDSKQSKKVLSK